MDFRPSLSFDALGILGIVLTIVFLVLDKAGKLKGGLLIGLLCLAGAMTLFLAIGNPWVLDAPAKWKLWRALLMFSLVAFIYSGLAIWISGDHGELAGESPATDETKPDFAFGLADSVNTYVPDKNLTMMFISAQILNRGADSAVIFHNPHYKSPTLDLDVNMLNLSQPRAIVFPDQKKTLILKHSNLITTKVANGLARGQSVMGRLAVGIPGDRLKEIENGVSVAFVIEDFTGKRYPMTYQSDPSRPVPRLLIAGDEEVEEKVRAVSLPSITLKPFLLSHDPYPDQLPFAGIIWLPTYFDVRLDIGNGPVEIKDLDFLVRLDTSIAGIGQISQFPGIIAFPAQDMPQFSFSGTDANGAPSAMPAAPAPGTMQLAPVYRVHCSTVLPNTTIHLAIASLKVNSLSAGKFPKQLFAPREAPRLIQVKGAYSTPDGKKYPLELSYQFPAS